MLRLPSSPSWARATTTLECLQQAIDDTAAAAAVAADTDFEHLRKWHWHSFSPAMTVAVAAAYDCRHIEYEHLRKWHWHSFSPAKTVAVVAVHDWPRWFHGCSPEPQASHPALQQGSTTPEGRTRAG
eukprot:1153224-Pelagomonas_calceolata.AAC.4